MIESDFGKSGSLRFEAKYGYLDAAKFVSLFDIERLGSFDVGVDFFMDCAALLMVVLVAVDDVIVVVVIVSELLRRFC